MTKHTPGPWYANNMWLGPKGVGPYAFPLGSDPEEAAANARLVAAAPELLQALETIADVIGEAVNTKIKTGRLPPIGGLLSQLEDTARAVIAKATGQD